MQEDNLASAFDYSIWFLIHKPQGAYPFPTKYTDYLISYEFEAKDSMTTWHRNNTPAGWRVNEAKGLLTKILSSFGTA